MNLKLLFSKAQSRYVLKNQVAFAESFLRFASYAEKDELIYPYWRVFDEAGKFFFIEECFLPSFAVKPRPLGRGYKAWRREATLSCGVRRERAISKTCSTPPGFVSIRLTSRLKPWLFSSGARVGSGTTLLLLLAICIARPAKG